MQLNAGVVRRAPSHSGQGCAQDDNRARLSGEVILPDYGLIPKCNLDVDSFGLVSPFLSRERRKLPL